MVRTRVPAVIAGGLLALVVVIPAAAADPLAPVDAQRKPVRAGEKPGIIVPQSFPGDAGDIVYSRSPYDEWPGSIWVESVDLGDATQLTYPTVGRGDEDPTYSPGGTLIAFSRDQTSSTVDASGDIYVMRADGSGLRRLSATTAAETSPGFSPDGSRLVFSSNRSGNFEIYSMTVDGADVRRLTTSTGVDEWPSWSPDGTRIVFSSNRSGNYEIYSMNPNGTSVARLTTQATVDVEPAWSPDGTQIAFCSNRTGDAEVFVMDADGSSVTNLTNEPADYDCRPSWSPDGSTIIYESDPYGDLDIVARSAIGEFLGWVTIEDDDEWDPDWQPIPAFPLVDAKFSPFKSDIEWVYEAGITSGCTAERYCPDASVTREQMASFLARALGLSGAAPDAFTDDEASIHEPNINLVAAAGIASGCAPGKFCPTGLVSREQMASFLARALKLSGTAPDAFTDDETSIHEPNINLVAREKIATGCGGTNYCPTQNVTRGQMAAFLHRAFGP